MAAGAPPRVLVLDDDPLLRRALERVARQNQVVLETVASPEALRARLEAPDAEFDLIVCDYRLRIDGGSSTSADLVRELASEGRPVVLMTGLVETIDEDVGAVPVLEKPLRLDDLLVHVRR